MLPLYRFLQKDMFPDALAGCSGQKGRRTYNTQHSLDAWLRIYQPSFVVLPIQCCCACDTGPYVYPCVLRSMRDGGGVSTTPIQGGSHLLLPLSSKRLIFATKCPKRLIYEPSTTHNIAHATMLHNSTVRTCWAFLVNGVS